ncbi:MAG: DUF2177 family protein [Pseudomonadota bacterium]
MPYITAYLSTAIVFLAIDAVWLGIVATRFYRDALEHLISPNVNFAAAAGFYLVYCIGIVIFAVIPALKLGDWSHAALYGALFGFFCYATYDMTNLATLRDWPVIIVIVDVAWGTFLTGTAAVAGYFITRALS